MIHDQYPGNPTNQQEAVFNELAARPEFQLDDLTRDKAIYLGPGSEMFTDSDMGNVLALLRVPTTGQESTYLLLGNRPDTGYYLTGYNADNSQLGMDLEKTRDRSESPIELGKEPGAELEVGRSDFVSLFPGYEPMPLGHQMGRKMRESFGEQTSRKHFRLSITAEGIMITDTSSNGTGVLHKKIAERV